MQEKFPDLWCSKSNPFCHSREIRARVFEYCDPGFLNCRCGEANMTLWMEGPLIQYLDVAFRRHVPMKHTIQLHTNSKFFYILRLLDLPSLLPIKYLTSAGRGEIICLASPCARTVTTHLKGSIASNAIPSSLSSWCHGGQSAWSCLVCEHRAVTFWGRLGFSWKLRDFFCLPTWHGGA